MKLTLVTPAKKMVTDLNVTSVIVPGQKGELEILPGHAPLITTMQTGVLKFKSEAGEEKQAAVSWGYCEVLNDEVSVLAETAEFPEEIDVNRAEAAFKKAEELMLAFDPEKTSLEKYHLKMSRAAVRLEVAKASKSN